MTHVKKFRLAKVAMELPWNDSLNDNAYHSYLVGSLGANLASGAMNKLTIGNLLNQHHDIISRRKLQQMIDQSGLNLNIAQNPHSTRKNYAYIQPGAIGRMAGKMMGFDMRPEVRGRDGTVARLGGSPGAFSRSLMAHEIGHGVVRNSKNPLERFTHLSRGAGAGIGGMAGAGLMLHASKAGLSQQERDKSLNWASILTGLGLTPTLANEALASARGYQLMKKMKDMPGHVLRPTDFSKAFRNYGRAGATYGLTALGAMAAPQIQKHYLNWRESRE